MTAQGTLTRSAAKPMPALSDSDRSRFDEKFERLGADECWLWMGALSGSGYGSFHLSGETYQAHRVAVSATGRAVPTWAVIDHTCRNRRCVNPQHLRAVDRRANVHENSSSPAHLNSLKTHCPRGHLLSGDNLVMDRGKRRCRSCKAAALREIRSRRSVAEGDGGPVAKPCAQPLSPPSPSNHGA